MSDDEPDLCILLQQYYDQGLTNSQILQVLHIDHNICISGRTLRRRLAELNLRRRNISFDRDQLRSAVQHEVETSGGNLGYRAMHTRLRLSYGIRVPVSIVQQELRNIDPEGVALRSASTLRRRDYINKGPNYLVHLDGYDKLKKFGLCIHGGIDGYSKKVLWLQVAHTNNDPKYVAYYFTQFLKEIKGVPRCIRMDRGTENTLIEDIQTCFRTRHNDDMATRSVLYGSSNHNQPIERWWRTCRQMGMQYFMDFFHDLEAEGHFETGNHIDENCIRYCFLHIIQQKLNDLKDEWNSHTRRRTCYNPGGIPNVLYSHPELRGDVDYRTEVEINDVDEVMALCMQPQYRGCDVHLRTNLDTLVTNLHGALTTPSSMEQGKELYLELKTALADNVNQ